ncbi:MAG TPA: HAD family hydrolase [Myxococcota bacterium]|nr:HAD family hydrolase [Myxococcota bacterium]
MRPFVFIDRDGTLIEDRHYAHELTDYAPLPGAYEAVRALRAAGFGTAVVTNQSGIGRGLFSEADFARFEAHLLADFAAHGAPLDASYHCPHLPDAGCDCRKPRPGLLQRAQREHAVDLARSWVIGDKESDLELARSAGCAAVLVGTNARRDAVPVAPSLLEAVQGFVLAQRR